jgi:hypothetical protein
MIVVGWVMLLASLGGCVFPDQRYVNHDAACRAMPCHRVGDDRDKAVNE